MPCSLICCCWHQGTLLRSQICVKLSFHPFIVQSSPLTLNEGTSVNKKVFYGAIRTLHCRTGSLAPGRCRISLNPDFELKFVLPNMMSKTTLPGRDPGDARGMLTTPVPLPGTRPASNKTCPLTLPAAQPLHVLVRCNPRLLPRFMTFEIPPKICGSVNGHCVCRRYRRENDGTRTS